VHLTNDELANRFKHHPPKDEATAERHARVRDTLLAAAEEIVELTGPSSREQSSAITNLELAMFWANAAIAREIQAPVE